MSYKNRLHYNTVCISFKFLILCMQGKCVKVENLTASAQDKYSSVL